MLISIDERDVGGVLLFSCLWRIELSVADIFEHRRRQEISHVLASDYSVAYECARYVYHRGVYHFEAVDMPVFYRIARPQIDNDTK